MLEETVLQGFVSRVAAGSFKQQFVFLWQEEGARNASKQEPSTASALSLPVLLEQQAPCRVLIHQPALLAGGGLSASFPPCREERSARSRQKPFHPGQFLTAASTTDSKKPRSEVKQTLVPLPGCQQQGIGLAPGGRTGFSAASTDDLPPTYII